MPLDLDAIERRAEAATPGKWHTVQKPWLLDGEPTSVIAGSFDPHIGKPICEPTGLDDYDNTEDQDVELVTQSDIDMDFIAHARTDIPALVRELRAAREALEYIRDQGYGCIRSCDLMEAWRKAQEGGG